MRRFASDIFTSRAIPFGFHAPAADRDMELGANIRREVFLIFKESVNNIVKHAGCTKADIQFQIEGDWLTLRVSDNGRGFIYSPADGGNSKITPGAVGGNGIPSMRRRAQEMGGRLEIVSSEGQGTTATLKVLVAQAPKDEATTRVGGVGSP